MKTFLRFIIITAVLAALFTTFAFAETFTSKKSGYTWTFDDATGTLSVTGKGALKRNMKFMNFHAGAVKHIVIDERITSIPSSAFARCAADDIVFPDGVTSIDAFAFYSCKNLKTVTLPSKLVFLGNGAFQACESLEKVTVPDSLRVFSTNVFKYCYSLTDVNLPDGLVDIGANSFTNTPVITNDANYENPQNPDSPGVYIGKYLIKAKAAGDSYVVNEGTLMIAPDAFSDAGSFTTISLPSSLRIIGSRGLAGCSKIRLLTVPEGVTAIYDNAFSDCTSLKTLVLPKSLRTLGVHVCQNCKELRDISYSGSVDDKYALNMSPDNDVLIKTPWYYGKDDPHGSAYTGYGNFKPTLAFKEDQFTDVTTDNWFYPNVELAYKYGLIKGKTESEFNPAGNITLAETLALACRLHSVFAGKGASFMQGSPWYKVYVDYAVKNGIIEKDDPETKYNDPATRAQFAEIMAKALPGNALKTLSYVPPLSIPDVRGDESYAKAVYMLYEAGIVIGSDDKGTFKPANKIARSEAAAIVTRMTDESMRKKITLLRAAEDTKIRAK